jgi:hypothetical protein
MGAGCLIGWLAGGFDEGADVLVSEPFGRGSEASA